MAGLSPAIIINADDLGIHPSINAGIVSAYQKGILSSCTMLTTTPFLDQTVRVVRSQSIPTGIHLSLTLGKAAAKSSQVPDLIDEAGNLNMSAAYLLCRTFQRYDPLIDQIRVELDSQLARARDYSLHLTHADSHQHVHMNPAIFAMLEGLLPRYGIDKVRYCHEQFGVPVGVIRASKGMNFAKWALLSWRSTQIVPRLYSNDDFFGIMLSGLVSKKGLSRAIEHASKDRCLEICIHPGFPAPSDQSYYCRKSYDRFIASPFRQLEHDVLLDYELVDILKRRGLALTGFDGRLKNM